MEAISLRFLWLYLGGDCALVLILSQSGTPIKCRTSEINEVLIFLSKGDEEFSDGETFTSNTQGFKFSSIKTSKPYNSK